jgi:tetratricopeptide (TPR) repeat protein
MPRICAHLRKLLPAFLVGIAVAAPPRSELHWIRMSSSHFSVLTDGNEKQAAEAILRFEQMRGVFGELLIKSKLKLPEPLEIVAFKNREEYSQIAPVHDGRPISTSGVFLAGEDRNYILLDLSDEESWRPVCRDFGRMLLNYNYPPTQAWFDEGFIEYFSSVRLGDKQAQIGSDPAGLAAALSSQPWLTIPKLFGEPGDTANEKAAPSTLFQAESWIVMHYLINQNRLPDTGAYFGLVENQNLPVEQAIQQAYGLSAAQFEQAVKDYFRSVVPMLSGQDAPRPAGAAAGSPIHQFLPVVLGDIATSVHPISDGDAQTLLEEAALRLPEHREHALQQLETFVGQPLTDTATAHHALAWGHLQAREYDEALQELAKATDMDRDDPWAHYYSALVKYQRARTDGEPIQGQANMMVDLRAVLDWDPDFAEAYNMLAMARMEGGGINAALESMRIGVGLNPRNQTYLFNLAQIYLSGKKWDSAQALFERLKDSRDAEIASAARRNLEDLPSLKKYGIAPQRPATAKPTTASAKDAEQNAANDDAAEDIRRAQPPPEPDRRKIQFLKGKLLAVDCSQPPLATLRVTAGAKTMKLRTADYKTVLVIGSDAFSCDWKNLPVVVNYKAGGKADGDLVSVEVQ